MADTSPLSALDLKEILEQISVPGSLTDHSILQSWIVVEYLHEHPDTVQFSAEFLAGSALERQLELWSQEYPLNEVYHDEWLKIFCLKWYYFQKKAQLAAFQKHQTLKKLGAAIVDAEVLATLIPGKETQAEELTQKRKSIEPSGIHLAPVDAPLIPTGLQKSYRPRFKRLQNRLKHGGLTNSLTQSNCRWWTKPSPVGNLPQ